MESNTFPDTPTGSSTPYVGRCLFEYSEGDVNVNEGSLVAVVNPSESQSHSLVYLTNESGDVLSKHFLVPSVYIEDLDESSLTDSVSSSSQIAISTLADIPSTNGRITSLHSMERILEISNIDIQVSINSNADINVDSSKLFSSKIPETIQYIITVITSTRTCKVIKTHQEIIQANNQLELLFPAQFQSSSISSRLLNLPLIQLLSNGVSLSTLKTYEKVMAEYLHWLLSDQAMSALLISILFQHEARVLAITEQPESSSSTSSESHSDESDKSKIQVPYPEDIPAPVISSSTDSSYSAFNVGDNFSVTMDDLDAFDRLLDDGYVILETSSCTGSTDSSKSNSLFTNPSNLETISLHDGMKIVVQFLPLIWDGASHSAILYEKHKQVELILGDKRKKSILPNGFQKAIKAFNSILKSKSEFAKSFDVILSPVESFQHRNKASLSKLSPLLQPSSHIILKEIRFVEISGNERSMSEFYDASGDDDEFKSGSIAAVDPMTPQTLQKTSSGALVTATGHVLPSPEEAEKALRAYLASIGQDISSVDEGAEKKKKKKSFLGIFKKRMTG
jgi:hypothetical protein